MRSMTVSAALAAAVLCVGAAAPSALAHEQIFYATLTGAAEAPPNNSPGFGSAILTVNEDDTSYSLNVSFSGLIGNTTVAHIHGPTAVPFTGTAGVMTTTPVFAGFPVGVTSGTYQRTFNLQDASSWNPAFVTARGSVANAANTFLVSLNAGTAYFNLHSSAFPGGELRGFFAIPEPATLGVVAAAGLVALKRRRA